MKKAFFPLLMLLLLQTMAAAQNLIIKGRVRCLNQHAQSTKGAENIVVVPTFKPSRAAITATNPSGYFEFNTGMPLTQLQDKQVNIYVVSGCGQCKEVAKRIFISEDQDRQNRDDGKSYITVRNWIVSKNCSDIELATHKADSVLRLIQQQPEQSMRELTNATAITGTPALLNLLTTLTAVLVPVPPATGVFEAFTLNEGDITYGRFLMASALTHTTNVGFNFAPTRDAAEAPFWNPAAMALSTKPASISLLTNVKSNGKLGGFFKVGEQLSLGAGFIYTQQDEFRDGFFTRQAPPNDAKLIDSFEMKLKEYAAYISAGYKVHNKLALGVAVKSMWQDFNIPATVTIGFEGGNVFNNFTFRQIKKQDIDIDLSALYKISNSFQVGVNAMNLLGTQLYGDAFTPVQTNLRYEDQRALGVGLAYKWQRFHFGSDVWLTEDGAYDATLGVNYVPFNDARLSAGYAIEQQSYSLALRLKHFRLAYINDNDFGANEKRKGKSDFLNGRLYGGVSFSF